jgi:hypothetical protein
MIALLVPVADAGQFFDAGHHGHAEHITMDAPPRTGRGIPAITARFFAQGAMLLRSSEPPR